MYDNIEFLIPYTKRTVAYRLIYAEICNGVKAGLLLTQLIYWWDIMSCTEFYKNSRQLQYECRLTKSAVYRAIKELKGLGFITTTRKGSPAINFFIINTSTILEKILEYKAKDGSYTNNENEPMTSKQEINDIKTGSSMTSKQEINDIKTGSSMTSKQEINDIKTGNPIYNTRLLHKTTHKINTLESNVRSVERTASLTLKVKEVIDYFNQKCKKQLRGSKTLVKDIRIVLDEFTMEQVKAVIDSVRNSKWHIEHGQVKLSAIMRPTKFHEKLEDIDTPRGIKVSEHPIRQMAGANCNTAPVEDTFAVLRR